MNEQQDPEAVSAAAQLAPEPAAPGMPALPEDLLPSTFAIGYVPDFTPALPQTPEPTADALSNARIYDPLAEAREARRQEVEAIVSAAKASGRAGTPGGLQLVSETPPLPAGAPYVFRIWNGYLVYQCRYCSKTHFSRVEAEEHTYDPQYRKVHNYVPAFRERYGLGAPAQGGE